MGTGPLIDEFVERARPGPPTAKHRPAERQNPSIWGWSGRSGHDGIGLRYLTVPERAGLGSAFERRSVDGVQA